MTPDGVALAKTIVAHFSDRRHQPLLDTEKVLLTQAQTLITKAAIDQVQTALTSMTIPDDDKKDQGARS